MNITLVVPYHANPELLARTLKSVIRQSDSSWVLIVCDDSKDSSALSVVESFSEQRFVYLKNPNPSGMVANWNFGVRSAATDWISILHADDELEPNYIALMRSLIPRFPEAGFLFCDTTIIDRNGRSVFSFPDYIKRWIVPAIGAEVVLCGEFGAASLLRGNFIFCPSICYRRDVLIEFPFDARYKMVQDLDLYLRLLENGFQIVGSRQKAYRYRRHENATAMLTRDLTRFHEEIYLYDNFAQRFYKRGWADAGLVAAKKRIILLHLIYGFIGDILRLRISLIGRKLPILRKLLFASKVSQTPIT